MTLKNAIKNYDPNAELFGTGNIDYGHNLAEIIEHNRLLSIQAEEAEKQNSKLGKVISETKVEYEEEEVSGNGFNRNKALEIISGRNSPTPKSIFYSPQNRMLLKGVLGRLKREAKMDIPYSPKMSVSTMLRIYNDARRILGLL